MATLGVLFTIAIAHTGIVSTPINFLIITSILLWLKKNEKIDTKIDDPAYINYHHFIMTNVARLSINLTLFSFVSNFLFYFLN